MTILTILLALLSVGLGALALFFYRQLTILKTAQKQHDEAIKDQFFEIVHEFRAPLTAMKDAAFLLHDMPGELPPDKKEEMLLLIKRECIQLLDNVSAVLDTSRVMNNKLTIQKTPNDLGSLAEEKVLWFTPQAKSLGIELVSDIDTSISKVMYDPKYMSHVLNNLMSNSLKYTPSGGMITVSVKQEGTDVRVSVFDNGKGIPTEKQKQLFQKFTNINAANDKTVSTGLGLFVVKGIVEAHGGKITIETQQNRGYKVSFTIPMTTMPASLVGAPTATVDAPLAPITPPIAG